MSLSLQQKDVKAYLFLSSLVVCGLAASTVTAAKIVHIGMNFPFSNIVFSIFTYPIVDCICELWGRSVARQTIWLSLLCQLLIMILLQASIAAPAAAFWSLQSAYQSVLATSKYIVFASLLAFGISQVLDIFVYQRLKEMSRGKWLWLRSNLSTYLGQIIDSAIFISIVFHQSQHKLNILLGSVVVKVVLSLMMTPVIYLIVIYVNRYLGQRTLAFKS